MQRAVGRSLCVVSLADIPVSPSAWNKDKNLVAGKLCKRHKFPTVCGYYVGMGNDRHAYRATCCHLHDLAVDGKGLFGYSVPRELFRRLSRPFSQSDSQAWITDKTLELLHQSFDVQAV